MSEPYYAKYEDDADFGAAGLDVAIIENSPDSAAKRTSPCPPQPLPSPKPVGTG